MKISYLLGMPRAATTFLYHNLQLHPEIFVPFRRKSNYFSLHLDKGDQWFLDHFSEATEKQAAVDTDTLGFVDKNIDPYQAMNAFDPQMKGILVLRSPDDWCYSLYKQLSTFEGQMPSYSSYLQGGFSFTEDGKSITFNYVDGDLQKRIEKIKQSFAGRLLIIDFKQIKNNPLSALKAIEGHLEISSFFNPDNIEAGKINASDRKHSKILGKLLRNPYLIEGLRRTLPRNFVIAARKTYDQLSANPNSQKPTKTDVPQGNFPSDTIYIGQQFAQGPVVTC